jgi:hypothetical protein
VVVAAAEVVVSMRKVLEIIQRNLESLIDVVTAVWLVVVVAAAVDPISVCICC